MRMKQLYSCSKGLIWETEGLVCVGGKRLCRQLWFITLMWDRIKLLALYRVALLNVFVIGDLMWRFWVLRASYCALMWELFSKLIHLSILSILISSTIATGTSVSFSIPLSSQWLSLTHTHTDTAALCEIVREFIRVAAASCCVV